MQTTARADKNRRYRAIPLLPHPFPSGVAFVPGVGGVVLFLFGGEIALRTVTGRLGHPEHRRAYFAAVDRAKVKLQRNLRAAAERRA